MVHVVRILSHCPAEEGVHELVDISIDKMQLGLE
jgi:hypothetical protein